MEYPIDQKMSENLFVQLLTDKANMLKKHLKTTQSDLVIFTNLGLNMATFKLYTGGSRLSQIFWEHENQSGLLVIQLIYIKLYRKKETKFWKKIQAKWESSLTAVWLKRDPPVTSKKRTN